jgi:hypothetical protein
MHKFTNEKPLRYFLESLLNNAYSNSTEVYAANSKLFILSSDMQDWKNLNFNSETTSITTLTNEEIENKISSFVSKCIEIFGTIHIVLDNIDQLHAPIAEYYLYRSITSVIKRYNAKELKYTVAMRPSTIEAIKEDVAAYKKFWLKTVDLKTVLEYRIERSLKNDVLDPDEEKFLLNLREILNIPVALNHCYIFKKNNLTNLISQVCGNNLREGKELFAEMVDSWYQNFSKIGGFGLLREKLISRDVKVKYIAEHIALRSLFMDNTKHYKFRNHLVNVFETPGLSGHVGVLIQLRILEILNKFESCRWDKLFDYLHLLEYKNDEILIAINHLKDYRLISTKPFIPSLVVITNDTRIVIRHRGLSYLNFIKKLSYIQLVYFMTELPVIFSNKFNYPNAPEASELKELSDNFLHSIEKYIVHEQTKASKNNVKKYENIIRPVTDILKDIFDISFDLNHILSS